LKKFAALLKLVDLLHLFKFNAALDFLLFVKSHVVERTLVSFDVDFERVQSFNLASFNALAEDLDALLSEEVRHRGVSDFGVIGQAVALETALHIIGIIVGARNRIFRQLTYPFD